MFTFENLFFLIVNFSMIYMCYLTVHCIGVMGIEWVGILHPYILQLKIYLYLPAAVKNRLQNMKPCCFSSDWQYKLHHAVQNNHLGCLKKAYENGCEWNSDVCNMLTVLNHKECLLYAHSHMCDWDWCTCDEVSGNAHECVERGLKLINDDTFKTSICDKLALLNNEKCLLFAHINGQDWDWCTCDELNGDKRKCVENGLYKIHVLPNLVA